MINFVISVVLKSKHIFTSYNTIVKYPWFDSALNYLMRNSYHYLYFFNILGTNMQRSFFEDKSKGYQLMYKVGIFVASI